MVLVWSCFIYRRRLVVVAPVVVRVQGRSMSCNRRWSILSKAVRDEAPLCEYFVHGIVLAVISWTAVRVCVCERIPAVAIEVSSVVGDTESFGDKPGGICWGVQPPTYPSLNVVCALGARRLKDWPSSKGPWYPLVNCAADGGLFWWPPPTKKGYMDTIFGYFEHF
jgi:hypothetical protein